MWRAKRSPRRYCSTAQRSNPGNAKDALDFTPNAEANELLRTDAFAFLTGVLFDQASPPSAHGPPRTSCSSVLDTSIPHRSSATQRPSGAQCKCSRNCTALSRKIPRWLVGAAQRVQQNYGGGASAIWSDEPSAVELQQRLREFGGIGQKKAAMAVAILNRDLGVPIGRMEGGDVAVDVHIRRVFLRSRIADRDDRDSMIAVARALHPSWPGALDSPPGILGASGVTQEHRTVAVAR